MTNKSKLPQGLYPDNIFIISDVETLKVIADPLRLQLLELLRRRPATVKEIARELRTPLKKLYYHVNLLEEHQLVRVSSTRVVSGIIEKQYQVTAYRLTVDRMLLSPEAPETVGDESLDVFLSFVLDHSKSEIRKSIEAGLITSREENLLEGGMLLGRLWMHLTPQQAQEYQLRLKELTRTFGDQQAEPHDPDARYYEILLGMYPTLAPTDSTEETERE